MLVVARALGAYYMPVLIILQRWAGARSRDHCGNLWRYSAQIFGSLLNY